MRLGVVLEHRLADRQGRVELPGPAQDVRLLAAEGDLVPAAGVVEVNGMRVAARDGAAVRDVEVLRIKAVEDAEIVLVDAA